MSQVMNATVVAATAYYSEWSDLQGLDSLSYQVFTTGTIAGTWSVEVSNVDNPAAEAAGDAVASPLTLADDITQPAGSPAKDFIGLALIESRWARMKLVVASGAGLATAFDTRKT